MTRVSVSSPNDASEQRSTVSRGRAESPFDFASTKWFLCHLHSRHARLSRPQAVGSKRRRSDISTCRRSLPKTRELMSLPHPLGRPGAALGYDFGGAELLAKVGADLRRPDQLLSVVLATAGPSVSSVCCVSAQLARNCRATAVGVPGWAV